MKLQFLVPQYKETIEIIRKLLDSIQNQINVDFNDIGVIIVNDGSDVILDKNILNSYPFEVKYILNEHKGVSTTRNRCLDEATADYVMFCDADDVFFNMLGLRIVLESIRKTPFDAMNSCFVEELFDPTTNTYVYPKRENDVIFVHGKIYNRKFLIDNKIRWCDDLLVHEDSYFNCLALFSSKQTRYCPTAFYMWRWNDNSVSRKDPYYLVKTYDFLLKSADKLSEDLLARNINDKAADMFIINFWQSFFIVTGKFNNVPVLKDKLKSLNIQLKSFYNKYSYLFKTRPEEVKNQLYENCRKTAIERNWYEETITFKDWVNQK